jgi:hypothetical protein
MIERDITGMRLPRHVSVILDQRKVRGDYDAHQSIQRVTELAVVRTIQQLVGFAVPQTSKKSILRNGKLLNDLGSTKDTSQNVTNGQRNIANGQKKIGKRLDGQTNALSKKALTHVKYGCFDDLGNTKNLNHRTLYARIRVGVYPSWSGAVLLDHTKAR